MITTQMFTMEVLIAYFNKLLFSYIPKNDLIDINDLMMLFYINES
jgi:hypothetical protein